MSTEPGHRAAKRRRTVDAAEEEPGSKQLRIATRLVRQIRNTNSRACFNALQDDTLERDDVYNLACEQCKLHEALLAGLETEASSIGQQGASFAHFMFNCLLNGTRERPGGGIGSADEQRSLNFLSSDVARAWPAWRACTLKMVEQVFSEESPVPVQVARDLLVMTVYALSHRSIAEFVLTHHLPSTWQTLKQTLLSLWDAEEKGIAAERNPGSSLEAYVNTIIALLQEQSLAIHGREWTCAHLKIEALGFETSEEFNGNEETPEAEKWMMRARKYAMFSTLGVANARAHMQTRGTVSMHDVNQFMEQILAEDDGNLDGCSVSLWEGVKHALCCKRRARLDDDN